MQCIHVKNVCYRRTEVFAFVLKFLFSAGNGLTNCDTFFSFPYLTFLFLQTLIGLRVSISSCYQGSRGLLSPIA